MGEVKVMREIESLTREELISCTYKGLDMYRLLNGWLDEADKLGKDMPITMLLQRALTFAVIKSGKTLEEALR